MSSGRRVDMVFVCEYILKMKPKFKPELVRRPRRLRRSATLRRLVSEAVIHIDDLIAPLFVRDGAGQPEDIESMPGVVRHTIDTLVEACRALDGLGIPAVALFPCLADQLKDPEGSHSLDEDGLVLRAVRAVRKACPDLLVITDIALDPYTTHGHDGVLTPDGCDVDNDRTVEVLARMAVLHASAGVSLVAPSDMMDGRVGAIRSALDASGQTGTGILAYSAKYASAYYGPFRDAVGSARVEGTPYLDKGTYQLNPSNRREARIEIELDVQEGADILMIKPAGPYLDIIREVRDAIELPVAAYQVSGEYAQIHAASHLGWLDYERCRDESLIAIKRAGADMILTYFAQEVAEKRS
jgi:porphobilinogen synthase